MAAKSKKKRGTKQTRTKKKSEQSFITDEIVIWITLAVSILILLSLFGLGGRVGKVVSRFLTDIFGTVTYIVPFLLFGIVAFVVSNKENFKAYLRALAAVFLTVLLCTFFQLINKSGGGTGAAAAGLLTPAVGIAGTYVIVIILMIV